MENDFFLDAGINPPMPAWTSLASTMEIQIQAGPSADGFFNWEKSTERSLQFDSALSSLVSSPAASNSNVPHDSFVIRELIGKLGNIGNSGEISPHSQPLMASSYFNCGGGSNSNNTSCYTTPLNSPPKLNPPAVTETTPFPSLTELSADPGFAERAARLSCIGSRSFNGRTSQFGLNQNSNKNEIHYSCNANPLVGNGKLVRISSSPSLETIGSKQHRSQLANSQDQSTISDLNPNGDSASKASNNSGSKKRKAGSNGKGKETSANATKGCEAKDDSNAKRIKAREENEKECVKAEEEAEDDEKQSKSHTNTKPPEPPKDYIHVRARRGQATDSHSLAERVRREKISERMKLLQDLVPGCNKVIGKALMLDEIINYVQSLQRQVEFLSMKLASVNTRLDFNMDSLISKDMLQSNSLQHQLFPIDFSASAFFGHQHHQSPALHSNPLDQFTANFPQCPTFCEGDLQTIVQMGLQSQTQTFHGSKQVPHMKVEL